MFEFTVRLMGDSPLTNQCLSELATHGSGLAQTPIMFAFNPLIGVVARSFNLFRKNFSGWVDSLRSALPISGISGVSTKALGRLGLFGWDEVLRIALVRWWGGIRLRLGRESWLVAVGAPAPGAKSGQPAD